MGAPVWTQSPRDWMPPLRDMSLTMVMDIMFMVLTTTERDPPMLRLRLTQKHFMDTPVTPSPTVELPPPTLPWDTPWPTLPGVSPTPPTLGSAPTTSVPSSLARQTVSTDCSNIKFC